MNPTEKEKLKSTLEEKISQLEAELEKIAVKNPQIPGDYKALFSRDSELGDAHDDFARDEQKYEVNEAVSNELELELQRAKAALEKLAKDDYGICAQCSVTIEDARLKAVPATVLCFSCASKVTLG